MSLEEIIEAGNDPSDQTRPTNRIKCADGFSLSVIAHYGAYCSPRSAWDHRGKPCGPFTEVEVGFPSERPEPWEPVDGDLHWSRFAEEPDNPIGTVYGWVPVSMVRALVRAHGGES
jgi:hypothetical protein